MRTSPAPGARRLAVAGLQDLGAAVAAHDGASRRQRQRARHRRGAGTAPIAALAQMAAQVGEARLVDVARHHLAQLALAPRRRREGRLPVPERAVAVGHRLQRHRRDVALQRHGRLDDAVGALVLAVRERDQLLADAVAVVEREAAHAADLVAALVAFDAAFGDDVVPAVVAVEVAQHRPDAIDRRVDHGRADDVLQHAAALAARPKWRSSGRRSRPGRRGRRSSRRAPARAPRRSRTRRSTRRSSARRRSPA